MKSKFLIKISLLVFVTMYVYADPDAQDSQAALVTTADAQGKVPSKPLVRRNLMPIMKVDQLKTVNDSRRSAAEQNNPAQESTMTTQSEIVRGSNPLLAQKSLAPGKSPRVNIGQQFLDRIQQPQNNTGSGLQAAQGKSKVSELVSFYEGLGGNQNSQSSLAVSDSLSRNKQSVIQVKNMNPIAIQDSFADLDVTSIYKSSSPARATQLNAKPLSRESVTASLNQSSSNGQAGMGIQDFYGAQKVVLVKNPTKISLASTITHDEAPSITDVYDSTDMPAMKTSRNAMAYNPLQASKSTALVVYDSSQKLQQPINEFSRQAPLYEAKPQLIITKPTSTGPLGQGALPQSYSQAQLATIRNSLQFQGSGQQASAVKVSQSAQPDNDIDEIMSMKPSVSQSNGTLIAQQTAAAAKRQSTLPAGKAPSKLQQPTKSSKIF